MLARYVKYLHDETSFGSLIKHNQALSLQQCHSSRQLLLSHEKLQSDFTPLHHCPQKTIWGDMTNIIKTIMVPRQTLMCSKKEAQRRHQDAVLLITRHLAESNKYIHTPRQAAMHTPPPPPAPSLTALSLAPPPSQSPPSVHLGEMQHRNGHFSTVSYTNKGVQCPLVLSWDHKCHCNSCSACFRSISHIYGLTRWRL